MYEKDKDKDFFVIIELPKRDWEGRGGKPQMRPIPSAHYLKKLLRNIKYQKSCYISLRMILLQFWGSQRFDDVFRFYFSIHSNHFYWTPDLEARRVL